MNQKERRDTKWHVAPFNHDQIEFARRLWPVSPNKKNTDPKCNERYQADPEKITTIQNARTQNQNRNLLSERQLDRVFVRRRCQCKKHTFEA